MSAPVEPRGALTEARPLRFVRSLWECRRFGLTRHNVRALWIQSDPNWLSKIPPLDVSDEEFDAFMEAIQ